MDRLPVALAARLRNRVVYRAAVREIRQGERGVWVIYADADGRLRRVDADYCVCTIPLPVLSGIQKDLSQPVQSAISAASYDGAGRVTTSYTTDGGGDSGYSDADDVTGDTVLGDSPTTAATRSARAARAARSCSSRSPTPIPGSTRA